MNIQCPNCETVFELPEQESSNKKYKCSVCDHIWTEKTYEYRVLRPNELEKSDLNKIIILNTTIFLLVIIVFVFFRNYLEDVDSYWKSLYLFFDMLIPIQ